MINRIFALLLLLFLSPILLAISLIILIIDGYPILFLQRRIGQNNNEFFIYKFRTMKKNFGDFPTHLVNNKKSAFTKTGPTLRMLSIDEIPQLINIIKGHMAFVGPRPALHNQNELIKLRTKKKIHTIPTGVTGWAQVNGRDNLSIRQKIELDEYYFKNKSFFLDIKIILMTIMQIFLSKDVSH